MSEHWRQPFPGMPSQDTDPNEFLRSELHKAVQDLNPNSDQARLMIDVMSRLRSNYVLASKTSIRILCFCLIVSSFALGLFTGWSF